VLADAALKREFIDQFSEDQGGSAIGPRGRVSFAGATKIIQPVEFHSALLAYEVPVPDFFLRMVAIALPWLEAGCGGALLFRRWVESAGLLVALMCSGFVALLGQAVIRGLDLRCGCFGSGASGCFDRPLVALVRAILLLSAAVWLLRTEEKGSNDRGTRIARE
jgi:hypothetical protein